MEAKCELCKRVLPCSEHHLIPREYHNRKQLKRKYTPEQLNTTIDACINCHSTVHRYFTNRELAYDLNTVEKLLTNEVFAKYVVWISGRAGRMPKTARRKARK